jgi:hypothetical protein
VSLHRVIRILPVLMLAAATPLLAQGASAVQLAPPSNLRLEIAAQAGWLGVSSPEIASWNERYDAGAGVLSAGYYLTPNLRLEVGLAQSGSGRFYSNQAIEVPDAAYQQYVSDYHTLSATTMSPAVSYRFLENRWVHPFLSGGAHVMRETHRMERARQAIPLRAGGSLIVPASNATVTTVRTRPFAGGGADFFVSERAFIRTELQLAPDANGVRTRWTAGVGVNF